MDFADQWLIVQPMKPTLLTWRAVYVSVSGAIIPERDVLQVQSERWLTIEERTADGTNNSRPIEKRDLERIDEIRAFEFTTAYMNCTQRDLDPSNTNVYRIRPGLRLEYRPKHLSNDFNNLS